MTSGVAVVAHLRGIVFGQHKNVAALATVADVSCPEIEPRTSRTDSDVFNHYAWPVACNCINRILLYKFIHYFCVVAGVV